MTHQFGGTASDGLRHISVGKDGAVWGAGKTDGALFYRKGGLGDAWIPNKDGTADVVAVVSENHVWCVNKDHQLWHLENGKWNPVPTHSGKADAKTISVGGVDGTVWYAQTDDKLFRREGGAWHVDSTGKGKATVIAAVSKDEVWCVNEAHEIWHLKSGQWTRIPTHSGGADAKTISVSADGTVWYGKTDDTIFRREGDAWHSVDGRATVLAIGSKDNVWCVNSDGDAFHRTSQGTWQKVDQPKGSWEYKVKQNDGLYAIVRQQYNLRDEKEVQRIVGLVAAENHIQNKDWIAADTVLKLQTY